MSTFLSSTLERALEESGTPLLPGFHRTVLSCSYCEDSDRLPVDGTPEYRIWAWAAKHRRCQDKVNWRLVPGR